MRIGLGKPTGSASLAIAMWLGLIAAGATVTVLTVNARSSNATPKFTEFKRDPAHASTGPNFLLICVDTLRADHVGFGGSVRDTTPNLDRFFSQGRIFERAYSATAMTPTSVTSILTGLYPPHHGVRLFWQSIRDTTITVADRLRQAGYQTAAVVSNAVLAGEAIRLAQRFDYYDDQVDEQEPFRKNMYERRASRTTDAAIVWLTQHRQPDRPHFLWVHYIDPHGPYRPPEDKPKDFHHNQPIPIDPQRVPRHMREPGLADGAEYVDRYDEEIAYADREIGRLLDAYRTAGLLNQTVVIFTADHGESMMDHDAWFRHEVGVYEEMIHIPLALRGPGITRGIVDHPVSHAGITATMLDLAELPIPQGLDAESLLASHTTKPVMAEGTRVGGGLWRAAMVGDRKYAVDHGMSNIIRNAYWFDVRVDPGEHAPHTLSPGDPMFALLDRYVRADPDPGGVPRKYLEHGLPAPNIAPPAGTGAMDRLRSLGYVGEDEP